VILDPDFAVALGNQEQVLSALVLLHDGVFGHEEQSDDVVYQKLYQFLVPAENRVRRDSVAENVLRHVLPETWRDHVQEEIQLLLVVQVRLSRQHELSYAVLKSLRQLHVLHRGVG